ncbi:MAG: hypothetical protein LBD77_05640 [Bifidobacteriaceae bacterium]|jgi:predicted ribosomally synthesized peptide with SipW-like signal peptide|nr:hypothetical protein [Bifidobacteriaceae bacterium]
MRFGPKTERQRRSRRFNAMVAGAAGVALLLGGSTFAFWSDSTSLAVGTVTNGELGVAPGNANGVLIPVLSYDLRGKNDGNPVVQVPVNESYAASAQFVPVAAGVGHHIPDLTDWRGVPGDQIEVDVPFMLTAAGDNIKYDLEVKAGTDIDLKADAGWDVTVALYKIDLVTTAYSGKITGTLVIAPVPVTQLTSNSFSTVLSGVTEKSKGELYALVVKATMDPNAVTGTEFQAVPIALDEMTLRIQQTDLGAGA